MKSPRRLCYTEVPGNTTSTKLLSLLHTYVGDEAMQFDITQRPKDPDEEEEDVLAAAAEESESDSDQDDA